MTQERRWQLIYWRIEDGERTEVFRQEGVYTHKRTAGQKGSDLITNKDVWRVEIQDLEDDTENRPFLDAKYWKIKGQLKEANKWPFS